MYSLNVLDLGEILHAVCGAFWYLLVAYVSSCGQYLLTGWHLCWLIVCWLIALCSCHPAGSSLPALLLIVADFLVASLLLAFVLLRDTNTFVAAFELLQFHLVFYLSHLTSFRDHCLTSISQLGIIHWPTTHCAPTHGCPLWVQLPFKLRHFTKSPGTVIFICISCYISSAKKQQEENSNSFASSSVVSWEFPGDRQAGAVTPSPGNRRQL